MAGGEDLAEQHSRTMGSSWGQEFELVQVQEPPAQDGHFQRVQFIGDILRDFTIVSILHRVSSNTVAAGALHFGKCGMKVLGHTAEACLSAL